MSTAVATEPRILAAEVWLPDHGAGTWRLAEASYGAHESLRPAAMRGRCDGLLAPWTEPAPRIVTELRDELAARGSDAPPVTAALVLPAVDGDQVVARCVLLLGGDDPAAVELWGGVAGQHELSQSAAWQPGLQRFTTISRHVRFPLGSGLPGRAWERGTAQVCADLAGAATFLRSTTAVSEGLAKGVALPVIAGGTLHGVALLLSGAASPLLRAAEIWLPADGGRMRAGDAWYRAGSALASAAIRLQPRPGVGLIGRAWASRRPVLAEGIADESMERGALAAGEGVIGALAVPTLVGEDVRSVCLLLW